MAGTAVPTLPVLHALRLKGFAEAQGVAELAQLAEEDVAARLTALVAEDLVLRRDGRLSGWALTPGGRAEHAKLVAAELDRAGCRDRIDACYRRFLKRNTDLLQLCTDWQVRGEAVNDHSDAAYDAGVVARLEQLHGDVGPIIDDLAAALFRFGGYRPRLDHAVDRTVSGDTDFFTRPMIDSYHTVWFELHEDLLVTLGLERGKEGA